MIELTAGQGSALSGLFTAIGAIVAVFLAQVFFRGKISDLKGAIKETETSIDDFKATIAGRLTEIDQAFKNLDLVVAGLLETAAKTQAAVHESQQFEQQEPQAPDGGEARTSKQRLTDSWYEIVDHLEEIASSPNIDGRTRAKYARIDRRSYYDLIYSLDADELLGRAGGDAEAATQLWYSNRRRNEVAVDDAAQMANYTQVITAIPLP